MTRTEVLKAGRELDALVATKIMESGDWFDGPIYDKDGNVRTDVPRYSTDIAAAWTVVEKLSDFVSEREHPWWSVAVFNAQTEHVMCVIYACPPGALINDASDEIATAISSTAPKAICLAALKAVGHE